MSFLQIKLLEAQIAAYRKTDIECRDKHSEFKNSTEFVVYKFKKRIIQLQEEYAQLDDRFKQVGP
jgi:hypothetical protein